MRSMLTQIINQGHGCTFVDFNGDLAEEMLDHIPLSRRNGVVYYDPANSDHVLPINPFYKIPHDQIALTAADFVHSCRDIWADSWGERMNWIMLNVVKAILYAPEPLRPTLLSIPTFLTIERYRKAVLKHVDDIEVVRFFQHEFNRYSPKERSLFIIPIENKIGQIISNPFVRNTLAPYTPKFQIRDAITNKNILIIRLAKGTLGQEPAQLIGALSVSTIINAALAQTSLPYEERTPHFLFIDEQDNLKSSALTSAYSELRKYKLGIVSALQYTDQMPEPVLKSMFGNIGTIIAFRSSPTDAQRFAAQLGEFPATQYTQLGLGEVRARTLRNGSPDIPFAGQTVIEQQPPPSNAKQIQQFVRERYTRPRQDVEKDYTTWLRKQMADPADRKPQKQPPTKRRHQLCPLLSHSPPATTHTITQRGTQAREQIKQILAQTRSRPNRRRKRKRRY